MSAYDYVEEDRGHSTLCWISQAPLANNGYARERVGGRNVQAHRRAWEEVNGPVPLGLELDHLCRVRACVNPAHLEAVTHAENIRRGQQTRVPDEVVLEVRRRYGEHSGKVPRGVCVGLAKEFGITARYVRMLASGKHRTYLGDSA